MEIAFITIAVFFILFLVRALVLMPNALAQVSADETKGVWNQIKAAIHYLNNVEKLKKIFIRDGKFTYKPMHLVSDSESKPSKSDNQG